MRRLMRMLCVMPSTLASVSHSSHTDTAMDAELWGRVEEDPEEGCACAD